MQENCRVYYCVLPEDVLAGMTSQELQREVAFQLLSRGFLEFFHIELEKEHIKREINGKPYYDGKEGCFFNISHCKNAVAAAVSKHSVGVDVESSRDVKYRTVEKCCSREEIEYVLAKNVQRSKIENLSKEEMQRFLRLWTLKESFVKMTGQGLRISPKTVCFNVPKFCRLDEHTFYKKEKEMESYLHIREELTIALTFEKKELKSDTQVDWIPCTFRTHPGGTFFIS